MSAAADFGAHWLWLEGWDDRADFLLKLVGLQAPVGVALGTLFGLLLGATEGALGRTARAIARRAGLREDRALDGLRALRLALLLAPALIAVGALLFSGGSMSRVAARATLQPLAQALLVALFLIAGYVAHRLDTFASGRPRTLRILAVAALGAGFGLAKLNQWVLPKLYDYLHGALTATAFALFMAAGYWLLRARSRPLPGWLEHTAAIPLLVLAFAAITLSLDRLERNQNVRVALLHPNAPHSRGVMQALAPYVIEPAQRRAMEEARKKARLARKQLAQGRPIVSGPVVEDAHVLLVTIDALRADHLGLYGYARPTSPLLDRLAQEAVVFERAYAPAPHSSYSLCSLMTSEYLHETLELGSPAPQGTLPRLVAAAGYHTAGFYTKGIFHTAGDRLGGYERDAFGFALHDQAAYTAEELTDRVLAEIDRVVARGEQSSLIWAHYFDVHEPYRATTFGTGDMDRYDSEILHVDRELDRLIRGARERLSRDVIVVISSDHGEEFHEHGGVYHGSTLYEEQIRVPLIVQAKGLPARRVADPVSTLDIAPTLLGLLGLPSEPQMRGRDLRPLALGVPQPPLPVFGAVIHKRMVVRWPHKLIADLRFGLFELYDLVQDPRERENLADQRPDLVSSLRLEVYGWLDSLAPRAVAAPDPIAAALDWGRLGDRRAVAPLSRVVADSKADRQQRVDAARMLGHLADEQAARSLLAAMADEGSAIVAAEAAIALGRMYDPRARQALRALVRAEDPDIRVRAAVSLGRLRDTEAVPALVEALWIANAGDYEKQEAVRWLGRLRDPRAVEPLIELLPESRTRFLVVAAIGMIGDRRAYDQLAQVLIWDNHANVRDATVQGLGLLGDARAVPAIAKLAAEEPTLSFATESLVRLGALQSGAIGGADLVQGAPGLRDFGSCHVGPLLHDWDYQHRTHCTTRRDRAALGLKVPAAVAGAEHGIIVALAIKRTDAARAADLQLTIDGQALPTFGVDGTWSEERFTLPARSLREGRVQAQFSTADPAARFAVDHLLLIPLNSVVVAQREGGGPQ